MTNELVSELRRLAKSEGLLVLDDAAFEISRLRKALKSVQNLAGGHPIECECRQCEIFELLEPIVGNASPSGAVEPRVPQAVPDDTRDGGGVWRGGLWHPNPAHTTEEDFLHSGVTRMTNEVSNPHEMWLRKLAAELQSKTPPTTSCIVHTVLQAANEIGDLQRNLLRVLSLQAKPIVPTPEPEHAPTQDEISRLRRTI